MATTIIFDNFVRLFRPFNPATVTLDKHRLDVATLSCLAMRLWPHHCAFHLRAFTIIGLVPGMHRLSVRITPPSIESKTGLLTKELFRAELTRYA